MYYNNGIVIIIRYNINTSTFKHVLCIMCVMYILNHAPVSSTVDTSRKAHFEPFLHIGITLKIMCRCIYT